LCSESASKPIVAHFDATGSILSKFNGRPVFYYCLLANSQWCDEPPFPLLDFLTNNHTARNLKDIVSKFARDALDQHLEINTVVTDFSWSLLQSVCRSFNNTTVVDQIKRQWNVIWGNDESISTFIRLCTSHYLHSISHYIARNFTLTKQV